MKEVFIVGAARTPLGSFGGVLASIKAPVLGSTAIKGALEKAGVAAEQINEVFMGNVVSANLGQAPARQAALGAGLPNSVPCTTVNKVCASGMKAIMFGAQSIMLGHNDLVVAGGMESMSNIPFYLDKARFNGYGYGHGQFIDGLAKDGLTDAYANTPMGCSGDATAAKLGISREAQDEYAIESYKRSAAAWEAGYFANEVVPVSVPQRKKDPILVDHDEEYKRVNFDKLKALKPVFDRQNGTVTAGNASTINDGAAAVILASKEKVEELGLKPIAKIVSFADAAQEPEWFTTAPVLAAPKALERAGLSMDAIDYFEVNEAFAVVAMAFNQEMGVDPAKNNVFGGGVSLGHPIGCSGTRIVVTLANVLQQKDGEYGLATLCNGGGGASAMVIQRVS